MAAPSTQPKNSTGAVCRFSDATGTPVTLDVPFLRDDFASSGLMQTLNEPVIYSAGGDFLGVGDGAPAYPQITFSVFVGNIVGSNSTAPGSPTEFAFGKQSYAANVSTIGANRKMTVDVRLTIPGTGWGDANNETVDYEDVLLSEDFQVSPDGNVITFTGTVLGDVVITNGSGVTTLARAA